MSLAYDDMVKIQRFSSLEYSKDHFELISGTPPSPRWVLHAKLFPAELTIITDTGEKISRTLKRPHECELGDSWISLPSQMVPDV